MSLKLLKLVSLHSRPFSTSTISCGKKNFRKFNWINRGTRQHREDQKLNPDPRYTPSYGVWNVLHTPDGKPVVETIPELVVPDLEGFKLKPYVSYRTNDTNVPEFTAKDLFTEFYAEKIRQDFLENKLDEDGNPLEPSPYEKMTPEQAEARARKSGSDLFDQEIDVSHLTQITKDYYLKE
uniref:39S ribosomal protein L41, mitochondrial n=1 Tax=Cacopsylla melanoneura TaxID=428564 RepID=A0A8D9FBW1_9HEMI